MKRKKGPAAKPAGGPKCPRPAPSGVYRARRPRESPLWRLLRDHLDAFLRVYDDRFAPAHGPLRPAVPGAVRRFLRCGILDFGFARIRCPECGDEFLLAHSCKSRCLCPSCQKKRQVEFGEWVATELMEAVPHRHVVLSVPRRLRPFFRRNRERLAKLARAAWESVKELLVAATGDGSAVPGAVACVQTYGNLLDWHPHVHMLVSWGAFTPDGTFHPVTDVPAKDQLEKLFRHKVLRMLQDEDAVDDAVVASMLAWHHTGFGAHVGAEIAAADARGRENVARYLCHPPVALGRIMAQDSAARVVYTSDSVHPRHGANFRVFDPLEFIAEVVAHIPDVYEKTAIEYGWYSNRTRGWRKKRGLLPADPPARDPAADSDKAPLDQRRAWARLIQKVYEVNPLLCPRCGSEMKVVAVIDDEDTVYKILRHVGLLAAPEESRAPPAAAPAASPASPPAQAPLPLTDAPASPPTALLDSIPRDLFSDAPAWDAPEPPAPDPAAPDLPGADADPGPAHEDFGDGDPPDDEDIA